MKQFKPHTLLSCLWSIALLCVASCSDEHDTFSRGGVPATFTGSIAGSEAVVSRASNATWAVGDKVGIFMSESETLEDNASFKGYHIKDANDAANGMFSPVSTSDAWIYPLDDSDIWFYAFYPYESNRYTQSGNTLTFTMSTDQSAANAIEDFDYLYYKNDKKSYSGTYPHAALTFEHKFSKIIINATKQGSVTNFDNLTVSASGLPAQATCNLVTGSVTAKGSAATTFRHIVTNGDTRTYEAIIIPHIATTAPTAVFNAGTARTHPLTKETFESGKTYTYNFILSDSEVTLSGASTSDWSDHSTTNSSHYLAVSNRIMNLNYTAATGYELKIETNSSNPVTVSRSAYKDKKTDHSSVSWLTLSTNTPSAVGGVTTYTQLFNVEANTNKTSQTAYLWVEVDDLTLVVEVTQAGDTRVALPANDANCYILAPGSKTVTIPVARAKYYSQVYDASHPSLGADEEFTAHVLWSDQPSLVTVGSVVNGAEGSFVVTTNSGSNQGNAVVAIRNASGHILWSWHIWVTTPAPTAVTIGNEPKKFMNRNLGAISATPQHQHSLGLLYQWGRKDPFTGASVFTSGNTSPAPLQIYMNGSNSIKTDHPIVTHTNNISITSSIAQPHTFFAGSGDWAPAINDQTSTGKSGLRWGPASGSIKALDDPCPDGYKVPTRVQFTAGPVAVGPGTFNQGYSFNGNWWSAAGDRNSSSGSLDVVGSFGSYWSATRNNATNGYSLGIYFGSVSSTDSYSKSYGFSVRCVSQ